jgi:hypothetical protein
MQKFNILVIVLAFCLGCVVMYVGNHKVRWSSLGNVS